MCGIFGVIPLRKADPNEVLVYAELGGQFLQHRGQEWAGMAFSDGYFLWVEKNPGLVVSFFGNEKVRNKLSDNPPQMVLMQLRFSTQGASTKLNAQPHHRRSVPGALALGANGDVFDYEVERKNLEKLGAKFVSYNDSEILLLKIMLSINNDFSNLPTGIVELMKDVRASYSAWLATENTVYLFRDPFANRPVFFMEVGGFFFFASENCALQAILTQRAENGHCDGTVDICQVLPGEIIKISLHGTVEYLNGIQPQNQLAHCVFEPIYFARPDSQTFTEANSDSRLVHQVVINRSQEGQYSFDYLRRGRNNADFRVELGRQLARECPVDGANRVIAIPDSGNFAAIGFAEESGLPFNIGLIRSTYTMRTFLQSGRENRQKSASLKYQPLSGLFLRNKRIVIVDDSIVFGTTTETVIKMCRAAGAEEIHMRISCPKIVVPCRYGVDMKSKGPLLGAEYSVEEICEKIGATSLGYLSQAGLEEVLGPKANNFCFACLNNQFRI